MEILKTIKAEGLNSNPSEETLNKANRPISNVGAGLYRNGFTVIPSAKVYGKTYNINGSTREGAVFVSFLYDENGKFVKEGTVSTNAILRQLYPHTNDATAPEYQITGIDKHGNTAVEAVKKLVENGLCIKVGQIKPMCAPDYIAAANKMDFSNMTKKDYPFFDIVAIPETIKTDLAKN